MDLEKDNSHSKSFTRRAFVIGAMQCGILGLLGGRLAWLQLAQGQRYKMLSDNNRINLKMITPSRGRVLDRSGEPLAVNEQDFRVLVIPEQAKDLESVLLKLKPLISLRDDEIEKILKTSQKMASFVPLEVKDNLNWDEVARIEVNLPELPGLSIDVGEIRSYPLGKATAHLVGYVSAVTKADLTADSDPVLTLPGFKIGKTGTEKAFDPQLRGTAGTAEVEVNVVGREVRELKRYPGVIGKTVKLTIDSSLQTYIQDRLDQERSASAVVMDIHSGAVYAMASVPSFDPNLLTRGISAEKWEELLADPGLPLNSKAVGGQYPPGSTFKMITALAGLEEKVITRNSSVECPGYYDFGGSRFHCWKRSGHGRVDLISALAESCDTYFYKMARELGIDKLAEYARQMGFGSKQGFELPEERPGLMPDRNWKMGHFGEVWRPGESLVASIGQGYIQATPLQLAVMTARLVNGGYAVKPWVSGYVGAQPRQNIFWPKLKYRKSNLAMINRGMVTVMNGSKGTARKAQIPDVAMHMGGKTGTSQVRRISMAERSEGIVNSDLPWHLQHHALFVGYAPLSKPKYACAVVVEHGGSGSATAAPIARDILHQTQIRNPADIKLLPTDHIAQMAVPGRKPSRRRGGR